MSEAALPSTADVRSSIPRGCRHREASTRWVHRTRAFIPVYAGRGGVNPVTNQTDGFYDAQNLLTYIPDQAAMRLYAGTVLTAS